MVAKLNQAAESVAASQTVTLGGIYHAGDIVTTTVNGNAVAYTSTAGDATLAGVAASVTAALNANATFALAYKATVASAVVTIAALRKGMYTGQNTIAIAAAVSGALASTTAVVGAATLAGGTGLDDLLSIV